MKKNKIIIIVAIIFSLFLFFASQFISSLKEENRATRMLINNVYSTLKEISRDIESLVFQVENETASNEGNLLNLAMLSNRFIRLDTTLNQYLQHFPSRGFRYGHMPNFDCISRTLISHGTGMKNIIQYHKMVVYRKMSWPTLLF